MQEFLGAHPTGPKRLAGLGRGGFCTLAERSLKIIRSSRFRQQLELVSQPAARGPMADPAAAAGNFSMRRDDYVRLGGFDIGMVGIEDQDFSHRHIAARRENRFFFHEAIAIHWDHMH